MNNDGTLDDSGFKLVYWDTNSLLQSIYGNTSALPQTEVFSYLSDSGNGDLNATIYSKVGLYTEYTICLVEPDITAPNVGSATQTHSDTASIGYTPNNGYDDDGVLDYTLAGSITDTGSGMYSSPYSYRTDTDSWNGWTTDTTYQTGSLSDGSHEADARAVDRVGNIAEIDGEDVVVDTDSPIDYTITITRDTGWTSTSNIFAYNSSGTIYFESSISDAYHYITILINADGTIQNSGYWRCYLDITSVFETAFYDSDSLPESNNYDYYTDTTGTISLRIINNAGNYQTIEISVIEDVTEPSTTLTSITENSPNTYIYTSGTTVWFSDLMGATDQLFTVNADSSDAGAGVYAVHFSSWDDDGNSYVTTPYDLQYSTDSTETAGSITLTAYDNVGNSDSTPITITMTEDLVDPSISINTGSTTESSLYLHYLTGTEGFYSNNMGSTQDFDVYLDFSDASSGTDTLVDNTAFGDDPSVTGSYYFRYSIDSGDSSSGTFTITYTATDNVGNDNTCQFIFRYDADNPDITFESTLTNESSIYLYYDDSSQWGRYGTTMPSGETFYVGGNTYDNDTNDAGIYQITDDTTFGDNPTYVGGNPAWSFAYVIDSADQSFGSFMITFTVTDNVGNTNTVTFQFFLDTGPTFYITLALTSENTTSTFETASISYGFYSDNMGTSFANFTIGGYVDSASGGGIDSIVDDTSFGDNPTYGISGDTWWFSYLIDQDDDALGTFTVEFNCTNNVAESTACQFEFRLDNTNPDSSLSAIQIYDNATFIYYSGTGSTIYFSDLMSTTNEWFNISVSSSDGTGSGINIVTFSSFGDNTETNLTSSPFIVNYAISSDETAGSITIHATDNCNNIEATVTITMDEDTTDPTFDDQYFIETSVYLFNSSLTYETLFYSAEMPSGQSVELNADVTDTESGIYAIEFFAIFDQGSALNDTSSPYARTYSITNTDTDTGNYDLIAYDNVGNTATVTITFTKDTTVPTMSIYDTDTGESSLFLNWDTTLDIFFYSDNMFSTLTEFNLSLSCSDGSGSGIYFLYDNTTFGNNPSNSTYDNQRILSQYITFQYMIDSSDSSYGNITVRFYLVDQVGNTGTFDATFVEDNTAPTSYALTSPTYETVDGLIRAELTGSAPTDSNSGMRTTNAYEWYVNSTRDMGTYWTNLDHSYYDWGTFTEDGSQTFYGSAYDDCGNHINATTTITMVDFNAPIFSLILNQDPNRFVDNYYSTTNVSTTVSAYDSYSGLPTTYLSYSINGSSWGDWVNTTNLYTILENQYNNSIAVLIRDNAGNTDTAIIYVVVDVTSPILSWISFDEDYSPNVYDPNLGSYAIATVPWTENYPYRVNITCDLTILSNDTSPTGAYSTFNITISGETSLNHLSVYNT